MMIFSQDKTTLINTDRMSVFNVEPYRKYDSEKEEFIDSKNGEYVITVRDSLAGGGWVTLGVYESKESAQDVLDELCDNVLYEKNKRKRCVIAYEMP